MEPDDSTELESPITTSHPFSTKSEMRAPQLRLGHARPHNTGCRIAVSEDEALTRKGWLR
jgi:hypothetical protein